MSDFENSRDFGANDNMGASPVSQETTLGGKDGTSLTQRNAQFPGEQQLDLTLHLGGNMSLMRANPSPLFT